MDGKLSSAQTALMLQEETLRRNDRERKALLDKVATLERSLQSADSERRTTQVLGASRAREGRATRREIRAKRAESSVGRGLGLPIGTSSLFWALGS